MKKGYFAGIILIFAIAFILVSGASCDSNQSNITILQDGMNLTQDQCKYFSQPTFIWQTGCPHCEKLKPVIAQVEQDLNITFKQYNLAVKDDYDKLQSFNMIVQGVPTVIINCHVYVGDQYSLEDFENAIKALK
jgi:thiol-disulfide isomerase/thioredoxin